MLGAGSLGRRRGEGERNDEKNVRQSHLGKSVLRLKGCIVAASAFDRHARWTEAEPFDARSQRIGGRDIGQRTDAHAMHGAPVDAGRLDVDMIDPAAARGIGDALGIGAIAECAELQ